MFNKAILALTMIVGAMAVASARQSSDSALARRVDILDAMVASLQKRVTALESQAPNRNAAAAVAMPVGREAWRRLAKSMSMSDVRRILGEPQRVEGGFLTYWYYRGGHVIFDNGNRVFGWDEPQ